MADPTVLHNTFVLERTYPVSPEKVFAAFADSGAKRGWFAEGDHHEVEHYEMDFRVGGREVAHLRFKEGTPIQGLVCVNQTIYLDIVPNRRIVFAGSMAISGKPFSAALATVELVPVGSGTELILTHQGAFFEGSDGPELRRQGWLGILDRLSASLAA